MRFGLGKRVPRRLLDRDLVIVDVGCRWGFADRFRAHSDQLRLYGFDPDEEECRRLEERYDSSRVTLVPCGLADREGKSILHMTQQPACSSIYEPDPWLTEHCVGLDCARKVGEVEIELTTLDAWAQRSGVEHVDYMKIDTQGSELSVLQGAERLLAGTRALEIEVEFNPIYVGQPLFGDVDRFLRDRGFALWNLTSLVHYGHRGENAIELARDQVAWDRRRRRLKRYGGQLYWADAHFVREEIVRCQVDSAEQRARDITLLECLGHLELAQRLDKASAVSG